MPTIFIMRAPRSTSQGKTLSTSAFTIVEALVAITILMIFAVTSTMTLNFFDERAARNRNAEAARAVVEDCVNYLLSLDSPPSATVDGTDIDGDGTPDGVVCTALDPAVPPVRPIPTNLPLIVTREASPRSVVTGTLYWRVQNVGTAYGCTADTDLVQISLLLRYSYHNQTFYHKAMTFKAKTSL